MALTRIKTNQITDLAVTTAKLAANSVTSAKLENNLTYGSDLTVSGNLTVSGTTTSVSTTNTRVEDAIIALSAEATGSASVDSGLLINRGSDDNQAFLWDESADEFVLANVGAEDGDTAGNVTISSYATLHVGAITATAPTFSGAVNIDDTTASTSVSSGSLIVDGGAGVAGALFVGGTLDVASGQTVDFNTNALTNVADPSNAQDAATKAYVDSEVSSGSTLTISDGSATDTVTVGTNTLTFAGTANEVTTAVTDNTVTIGLPDDVTIAGDAIVTGNLTVNGTTTTISTTNSVVSDNLIELNNGASSNANDSGIVIERGSTGDNAIFAWDESADVFIVGTTTATGASTGDLSITAAGFTAAAVTADSVAVGGGYGSTGITLSTAGVIQANGAATVDGLASLDGGIDVNSANFSVSTAGVVNTVDDIQIQADNKNLEIGANAGGDFTIGHNGTDTTITNITGILAIDGAASSAIRVNEAGADVDFIIEGDTATSLFVVDAGNDNVGVGGAANANAIFHINDTGAMILAAGTTAQRPTGVTGMFRYNTTTNQIEYYDNDSWESVSTAFTLATSQTFNGDDSTVAFTLSSLTGADSYTVAGVLVMLNGVVQEPTTVYGITGTTLTFTTAPATGDLIEVRKFTTTTTVTSLSDADGDTLVQVEESSDDDTIRFDVQGVEKAYLNSTGLQVAGNIHATGTITADGDITLGDASSDTVTFTAKVGSDIIPTADSTYDLGSDPASSGFAWANVYADTYYGDGSNLTGIDATAIQNGTSNVQVASGGDITVTRGGTLSATFTASGITATTFTGALSGNATTATTATTANGVAANSVALGTDTTGNYVAAGATSGSGISGSVSSEGGTFTVTSNATSSNSANTIVFRDGSGNFSANVITGTSTAARYADLAEMYAADEEIAPGTVVHFAGEGKLAACDIANCRAVAGIISTDPAHLMNSAQEGVALALAGRVPCKVTGPVAAGDLMVSAGNGMAMANNEAAMGTVIGKAIEANADGEGVIEVLALMM